MKLRHESKHFINKTDHMILRQRLAILCNPDPYAGAHGIYRVRSLYFDNYKDKSLMEKINGVNRRERFRIRLYNSSTDFIRLEKKIKFNGLCSKSGAALTKAQVTKLLNGDFDWMLDSSNPLVNELYSKMRGQLLRPIQIVEYSREPFVYPAGNVRITLDSDMRSGTKTGEFLEETLHLAPSYSGSLIEIKYDNFIPEVIQQLVNLPCRPRDSFSKYVSGRTPGLYF